MRTYPKCVLIAATALALAACTPAMDPPATPLANWIHTQASAYSQDSTGAWVTPNTDCWACVQGGLSSAEAASWTRTSDPTALANAIRGIEAGIHSQGADGGWLAPASYTTDTQSEPDRTTFFADEEAATFFVVYSKLTDAQRTAWRASIASAAKYLTPTATGWYTNGNINLGQAELLYLAWKATGDSTLKDSFEAAWAFLMNPGATSAKWVQYGYRQTSFGGCYLTETGSFGTGWDPNYTILQLNIASRLFLLTGEQRFGDLASCMLKQEMSRVSTTDWSMDQAGGTRHSTGSVGFDTSAFAVLALHDSRSDLQSSIAPALDAGERYFNTASYWFRALGTDFSVSELATGVQDSVLAKLRGQTYSGA